MFCVLKKCRRTAEALREERACAMMSRTHYKRKGPNNQIQPSASNCETYFV